jgi:hypothetical protein
MSIFGNIASAIFGKGKTPGATPLAPQGTATVGGAPAMGMGGPPPGFGGPASARFMAMRRTPALASNSNCSGSPMAQTHPSGHASIAPGRNREVPTRYRRCKNAI